MAKSIIEIGKVYPKDEPTASLELSLDDLYWVQSLISHKDTFRRDLQGGIDAIEKHNQILSEKEGYGLSIVISGRR